MLYVTGDTHGDNLGRFSFKRNPKLRGLTEDDAIVVLGDTALMWPGHEKETVYTLRQLARKPFTIIFLLGNHDNYDWAETLPQVDVFGGRMRQVVVDGEVFSNRYVIDSWTTADLSGYHCMLIAHAKSHDIQHLYTSDDREGIERAKRNKEWFRVAHRTWWPQEELDTEAIKPFIQEKGKEHFDAILTHDCPGLFVDTWEPKLIKTQQEQYFDHLRAVLDFDVWAHGHMHWEWARYSDTRHDFVCIYRRIFDMKTIEKAEDVNPFLLF